MNDFVYSAVKGLVETLKTTETKHDWPVYADINSSYSIFSLEDNLPGKRRAVPFLQISSTIKIKHQSEDTIAGFKIESNARSFHDKNLLLPSMVPKGSQVKCLLRKDPETVDKYLMNDGVLTVKFVGNTKVELPCANYSISVQRFCKLFTASTGQKYTGYLLGVRGGNVHVLFPGAKSWSNLPEGVSVSSPHNGAFNSFSLQILTFPSMNSAANFLTPVSFMVNFTNGRNFTYLMTRLTLLFRTVH